MRQGNGDYLLTPAKAYWARTPADESVLRQQVTCIDYPSGCAHSNARDFAQLMRMLTSGGIVDGVRILAPASVQLMTQPAGFRNHDGWNQGLGLNGPLGLRGQQLRGHDGVDRGAVTAFYFNPKTGGGAITFANANDPDFSLGYGVTDIALHLIAWFE